MTMTVINDLHLGVVRSSGTTPASALKLRQDNLQRFDALLQTCEDDAVLINGDLFDTFSIPHQDLWESIQISQRYLAGNEQAKLYAARGNHDLSRNGTLMSSFDLYCKVLSSMFPERFFGITEPTYIASEDAYVIPHLLNQDRHDAALLAVPACSFLFLHANYDNFYALEADHSVNVTKEQCRVSPAQVIVFGHEHSHKTALAGKVMITGCQLPTSVADWVSNDVKYLLRTSLQPSAKHVDESAPSLELVPVLQASTDFSRQDWRNLQDTGARFIRVEGEATASEAADAVSAISKFRARSDALVITNAVRVEGATPEEIELSVEQMAVFDVKAAVLELLTEQERTVLLGLLEG